MTVISFKQYLNESSADKGILKAVFVVGIPGAGKSYTVSKLRGAVSPVIVNTDKAGEFLSRKAGAILTSELWPKFKDSAHRITRNQLYGYLDGMLPLFIDGTSNDASNILHRMGILQSLGYDIGMIHVNTDIETAIKRAQKRVSTVNREVDVDFIRKVFQQSEDNVNFLKSKVAFFKQIDNDSDGQLSDAEMLDAFKVTQSFFNQPVQNPIGHRAIELLKEEKQKYLVPTVVSKEMLSKKIEGWYKS